MSIPTTMRAVTLGENDGYSKLGNPDLQSTVQKRLSFSSAQQAVELYQHNKTSSKVV